jgi:hypothetical protein
MGLNLTQHSQRVHSAAGGWISGNHWAVDAESAPHIKAVQSWLTEIVKLPDILSARHNALNHCGGIEPELWAFGGFPPVECR